MFFFLNINNSVKLIRNYACKKWTIGNFSCRLRICCYFLPIRYRLTEALTTWKEGSPYSCPHTQSCRIRPSPISINRLGNRFGNSSRYSHTQNCSSIRLRVREILRSKVSKTHFWHFNSLLHCALVLKSNASRKYEIWWVYTLYPEECIGKKNFPKNSMLPISGNRN